MDGQSSDLPGNETHEAGECRTCWSLCFGVSWRKLLILALIGLAIGIVLNRTIL